MNDAKTIKDIDALISKYDAMKKKDLKDLSSDQDLTIAIMNLVSIEEHFFFTGAKLNKTGYFDLINEVRDIRKELLQKVVVEPEGEVWCISKHVLAATMRLEEVGTKELKKGHKQSAADLFTKAYKLYFLFWGLNLKITDHSHPLPENHQNIMLTDKS